MPDRMGLPPRVFLYTLDQIATMVSMELPALKAGHIFFDGRQVGKKPATKMRAQDISGPEATTPDWRVTEDEFIKWLKFRGFRIYDRTTIR